MLQILNTGRSSAQENMDCDASLLERLDPDQDPVLHLYEWIRPSLTYGYFIDPSRHLRLEALQAYGIDAARRPTGGGIVFHLWDLAFSFLMPSNHPCFSLNTLDNYRFVNQAVLEAMKELLPEQEGSLVGENFEAKSPDCIHFCMARPTRYDVVYQGRKIAGAAQRRRKQGYLHQGTLSLASPDAALLKEILVSQKDVLDAMLDHTFIPSLPLSQSQKLLTEKLAAKLSLKLDEQAKKDCNHSHSL